MLRVENTFTVRSSQENDLRQTIDSDCSNETSVPFRFVRKRNDSLLANSVDPSFQPKYLTKFGTFVEEHGIEDIDSCSKVLVLNTGGTIGMKTNKHGFYEPITPHTFVPRLRQLPMFHDPDCSGEIPLEAMILQDVDDKPIIYTVYDYDPLLDSSNMTMDDWKMLAKDIAANYQKFDGFVILHGTDTMAYTASALSFMLENLGKPVILTGAQISIFEPRSDGIDNLLGALIIAGQYMIPEVCLYFNNTLMRGCRSSQVDSGSFACLASPNYPPLATVGIQIDVHWNDIFKHYAQEKFTISTNLCPHVGVLRLFPSINVDTVHIFLQPPMKGVVLQCYGAGNGPSSRKDLFKELKEASSRGLLIVSITQCNRGAVNRSHETGAALAEAGVISGSDMTAEAALTKLAYVIGKEGSFEEKRRLMEQNLRGEMTVSSEIKTLSKHHLLDSLTEAMHLHSERETAEIRDGIFPPMMCNAARIGDIDALQTYFDTGCSVSAHSSYDGRTPLHVAASEGKVEVIQFLLNHGSLVHIRDVRGDSPLMNAIEFGHDEAVKLLVKAGAHLTLTKVKLANALSNAAMDGRIDQMKCWLLAGADLNTTNHEGRTGLHIAAGLGKDNLVDWFLTMKAVNLFSVDVEGLMAVDLAEKAGHGDIATSLRLAMSKEVISCDSSSSDS